MVDIRQIKENFTFEILKPNHKIDNFDCEISEYSDFLKQQALQFQDMNISKTYVLLDKDTNEIVSYMSLISDSIKITPDEKETHQLGIIPFNIIPAIKIAKLAVSIQYKDTHKYIGTHMISVAKGIALNCNRTAACRFLTLDADIEHNPTILGFYRKNGFIENEALRRNNPKTISMRLDLLS